MIGFDILHLEYSPIKGPEGNIEYLVHLCKNPQKTSEVSELTEKDAEERLQEIQVLGRGISTREQVQELIGSTVKKAHGALD